MNRYAAYAHRIPGGVGYWAMLRLCRDAHPAPIMAETGKPKVFPTKGEASEECLRHLVAFINGRPIRGEHFDVGSSEALDAARLAADTLFRGGGKTVQVERMQEKA